MPGRRVGFPPGSPGAVAHPTRGLPPIAGDSHVSIKNRTSRPGHSVPVEQPGDAADRHLLGSRQGSMDPFAERGKPTDRLITEDEPDVPVGNLVSPTAHRG